MIQGYRERQPDKEHSLAAERTAPWPQAAAHDDDCTRWRHWRRSFRRQRVVVKAAGPAAVLSFVITGLLVVLVMRMLGEMAVALPAVGSFYEYARLAWSDRPRLGELAGFLAGWMYWYFWVIVVALEAVAGAGLIRYWLPNEPAWLVSLGVMLLLTLTNLISVRSFGRVRILVRLDQGCAIVVFLLLAGLFVLGLWPGVGSSVANLTAHGGFAPNGVLPILTGAVAATGFYFGAEIVTIAAAEADEPAKAVAKATNSVITRVLLFYVGSILLVVCLVPWNSARIDTPYVSALSAMGIPAAAQIMNAVVSPRCCRRSIPGFMRRRGCYSP